MNRVLEALMAVLVAAFVFLAGCESSDDSAKEGEDATAADTQGQPAQQQAADDKGIEEGPAVLRLEDCYGAWEGSTPIVFEGTNYLAATKTLNLSPTHGFEMLLFLYELPSNEMANYVSCLQPIQWDDETKSVANTYDNLWSYVIALSSPTTAVLTIEGMFGGLSMDLVKWSWDRVGVTYDGP